mmetsp:Transcript_12842/g.54376  ORF Transcript_12842/g.54376 Transcript_12842/m.54376 type:complete len:297 (-) Transcript_12842:7-897(-)
MATSLSSVGPGGFGPSRDGTWNSCDDEPETPSKLSNLATFGKHAWLTREASSYTAPPRTRLSSSSESSFECEPSPRFTAMIPNAFFVSLARSAAFSTASPAMARRSPPPAVFASVVAMVVRTAASSAGRTRSAADASLGSIPSPAGPTSGHSRSTASRRARARASPLTTCARLSSAHAPRNRSRSRSGALSGGRHADAMRSAAHTTAPCPAPRCHGDAGSRHASHSATSPHPGHGVAAPCARHDAQQTRRNSSLTPTSSACSATTVSPASMSRAATRPTPRPGICRWATAAPGMAT